MRRHLLTDKSFNFTNHTHTHTGCVFSLCFSTIAPIKKKKPPLSCQSRPSRFLRDLWWLSSSLPVVWLLQETNANWRFPRLKSETQTPGMMKTAALRGNEKKSVSLVSLLLPEPFSFHHIDVGIWGLCVFDRSRTTTLAYFTLCVSSGVVYFWVEFNILLLVPPLYFQSCWNPLFIMWQCHSGECGMQLILGFLVFFIFYLLP